MTPTFIVIICSFVVVYVNSTPNIVFFMPDDMQFLWDEAPDSTDSAVFKPSASLIPNMNRIRSSGAVFTNAYVAGPKCAPSRFSVLTGRYCSRAEWGRTYTPVTEGNYSRYDVTVPTCKLYGDDETNNIQTLLSAAGYSTIHSGKWHLAPSGTGSFDDYDATVSHLEDTGFTSVASVWYSNMGSKTVDNSYNFSHNLEWATSTALTSIEEAVNADTPFFLHYTPTCPHGPSNEGALLNYSVRETPSGLLEEDPVTTMPSRQSVLDRIEADYPEGNEFRDTSIGTVWTDDALGALIDGIDALGVLDNTLFVFTMDHGQLSKETLYQGGVRVSLFVMGPEVVKVNVSTPVNNIDLVPSILEAAHVSVPEEYVVDGISWWGSVSSAGPSSDLLNREYLIAEMDTDRTVIRPYSNYVMKYLSNYEADEGEPSTSDYPYDNYADQLYNITADTTEQVNLASDAQYASHLSVLQDIIDAHDNNTGIYIEYKAPTAAPTVGVCDFTPTTRLGNGICNGNANTEACLYDYGDCCETTCLQNTDADILANCGSKPYDCIDPNHTSAPTASPTISLTPTASPTASPTTSPTASPTASRDCTYGKLTSDGKTIKQPYPKKKPQKYDDCPAASTVMSYDTTCLPTTDDTFSITAEYQKMTIDVTGGGKFKVNHKRVVTFNKEDRFEEFMLDACRTDSNELLDIIAFSHTDGLHMLVTVRDKKGRNYGNYNETTVYGASSEMCGGQTFGPSAAFTCVDGISEK